MTEKSATYRDLASKGEGVLVKRGSVWTYPSCETDRSGTNIQLPTEYVSDAEVQQALRDGKAYPATTDGTGAPVFVRVTDGDIPASISVVQAGTPEAGTELPPNSRPTHDAGMKPLTEDDAQPLAAQQTRQAKPESSGNRQSGGSAGGNKTR